MARWTLAREKRLHKIPATAKTPSRVCFEGVVIVDASHGRFYEAFWTCPECQHDMHDVGGTTYDDTQLPNDL